VKFALKEPKKNDPRKVECVQHNLTLSRMPNSQPSLAFNVATSKTYVLKHMAAHILHPPNKTKCIKLLTSRVVINWKNTVPRPNVGKGR
jgi:hypothetical protein